MPLFQWDNTTARNLVWIEQELLHTGYSRMSQSSIPRVLNHLFQVLPKLILSDRWKSWGGDGWACAWVASVIGSVCLKVLILIQILLTFNLNVTQAGRENANLLLLPFPLEHSWVYKFRYCHFLSSFGSHVWESCTGMYRYIDIDIWVFINQITVEDMLAICMSSISSHTVTFLIL